jgi:hypothetical protein
MTETQKQQIIAIGGGGFYRDAENVALRDTSFNKKESRHRG